MIFLSSLYASSLYALESWGQIGEARGSTDIYILCALEAWGQILIYYALKFSGGGGAPIPVIEIIWTDP